MRGSIPGGRRVPVVQPRRERKQYVEVLCPMCGQPMRNLPDQPSAKGNGLVWAWVNADGSRHRCGDFRPKVILNVPYEEKEEAKALGARWDLARKTWYIPSGEDAMKFARWDRTIEQWHDVIDSKGRLTAKGVALKKAAENVPLTAPKRRRRD